MNAIQIHSLLLNYHKGQHLPVTWQRHSDTYKDAPIIAKRVRAYVRAGIAYANLKSIKEAIATGVRGPVQSLPWGQWRAGYENYIIDHEKKNGEVGEYVRLYPAVFANLKEPEVEWTLNGRPATYGQVEPYLKASEKRPDDRDCFCVNAMHVIKIG